MTLLTMLLAVVMLQAPIAAGPLVGTATPLHRGEVISFFGDSITYGGGYIALLRQALDASPNTKDLDVKLVNRAINGGCSTDLRDGCKDLYGCTQAPFADVLKADHTTLAVIYIGINDVWHGAKGNPPGKYEAALRDLLRAALAQKVRVLLCTPSTIGEKPRGANPLDKQLDEYADIVKTVGREKHVPVVDVRAAFFAYLEAHRPASAEPTDKGILTSDGVHPIEAGNHLLAEQIARGIFTALRRAPHPR